MFRRTAVTAALFITFFALASQDKGQTRISVCRSCAEIGMGCCLVNGSFRCC